MLFANALKDYVDQINDLAYLLNDNFTIITFLKSLVLYLGDSIKLVVFYIFSCKWLTDFIELPCRFKANYIAILEGQNLFGLNSEVNPNFFQFLETQQRSDLLITKLVEGGKEAVERIGNPQGFFPSENLFVTGLLNSFFLALPLSVPHLLTLRAFLINGLVAGIACATGTIVGQFCFFSCVFFGFEWILQPWISSFMVFDYVFGFLVIIQLLYRMAHKPDFQVLNWSHLFVGTKTQQSGFPILLSFFGLNFFLAWTEQTSLFQYFGNLTLNTVPTLLQGAVQDEGTKLLSSKTATLVEGTASVKGVIDYIVYQGQNSYYLIGILLGSIFWTVIFGSIVAFCRNTIARLSSIPFMFLNEKIHNGFLVCTFTLCLTSLPYYGFDYLISAPLGFLSQDKALNFLKAKTEYQTVDKAGAIFDQSFLNPIPFDRTLQMESKSSDFNLLGSTFEDSSIDSENSWKNRLKMRPSGMSRMKSSQTSRRRSGANMADERQQETQFLENFYKSKTQYGGLVDNPTRLVSKIEKDIDKMAANLFNSIAYDYYDENNEDFPYTRKLFREKFYKNPIYRSFVNLDTNLFLQGMPKFYNLQTKDEADLYTRRVLLENYLNSINEFKGKKAEDFFGTPHVQNTAPEFSNSLLSQPTKNYSYADKVYNQQFKGSLDLIRHYFSIHIPFNNTSQGYALMGNSTPQDLEGVENKELNNIFLGKVLKFDQPLYKNTLKDNYYRLLHEELSPNTETTLYAESDQVGQPSVNPDKNSKELSKTPAQRGVFQSTVDRAALLQNPAPSESDHVVGREDFDGTPFYIGWDSSLRKFLIKKACTPGIPSGTQAFNQTFLPDRPLDNQAKLGFDQLNYNLTNSRDALPSYLVFQSWPITLEKVLKTSSDRVPGTKEQAGETSIGSTKRGSYDKVLDTFTENNQIGKDSIRFEKNLPNLFFGKRISLPYTPLNEEEALKVAKLLGLDTEEFNKAHLKKSSLLETQKFPLYNWNGFLATKQNDPVAKELKSYIDLGNTLPPQFGGFAWPGTLMTKFFTNHKAT